MEQKKLLMALKKQFFTHKEILFAYLFGSLAKGYRTKDSDIDVAAWIETPNPENNWKRIVKDMIFATH